MAKGIYIHTFGCQMNVQDSEKMTFLMGAEGYEPVISPREADLVILNTCSIRQKAVQKIMSRLGRLRDLKRRKPTMIIAVGGCLAQQWGKEFLEKADHLDIVFGTHNIHRLPEMVRKVREGGGRVSDISFHGSVPSLKIQASPEEGKVGAYVTIMQGCDNFCTYCVVPLLRGPEESRPLDEILAEIRCLADRGIREVTLLGQNVNSYGRNLPGGVSFARLLREIDDLGVMERVRFTTSHPRDLSDEVIGLFGRLRSLCEHIHLPVQSGSDAVLTMMNRGYTRDDYLRKVEKLRDVCPDIAVSSDMIVGFPGETEKDFLQTLDLMEKIRFDNLFSFKYSEREGTVAVGLPGKVPEEEKARRLTILQGLQDRHALERNRSWEGREVEVLVEGPSKGDPREMTGRTRGNKIVNFPGRGEMKGRLVKTRIVRAFLHSLRGEPVAEE